MSKLSGAAGALFLAIVTVPAGAHHSVAPFDFRNTSIVSGKVVDTRFANPHMRLVLEVSDEERGTRDIEFEITAATTCAAKACASGRNRARHHATAEAGPDLS